MTSNTEDLDLDTLAAHGVFGFASKAVNSTATQLHFPEADSSEAYGVTIGRDSYVSFQICVCMGHTDKLYYRSKWSASNVWNSWKEL